jgi:hypothetical protein
MVPGSVTRPRIAEKSLGSSMCRSKTKEDLLAWAAALARDSYRGTDGGSKDPVTPIYMQIDSYWLTLRKARREHVQELSVYLVHPDSTGFEGHG